MVRIKKNNEYPLIINSYNWTSYSSTEFQKVAFTDYSVIQYNIYLPCRPSLIWVTSIQIRLNIVNLDEDSNVLINIPIDDYNKYYITYYNYDLINTAKKLSNTFSNGYIEVSLTQQNGYELDLRNCEYCLNILVFKVDGTNVNWGYQGAKRIRQNEE